MDFLALIMGSRKFLYPMVKRDLSVKYAGSVFGGIWNVIHPCVLILIFWIVFSLGFRVKPMNDAPFVVWLTAGMAAWFFFADAVGSSTTVIVANANIIKKTLFPSHILPLVKIVTALVQHLVFLSILIVLIVVNHVAFDIAWFQVLYYMFCSIVFVMALSWTASAFHVFVRDTEQIVNMILQVGFWATPVFWDLNMLPVSVQNILKLNPLFYIVQGYRDSFIYHVPFWKHPYQFVWFWTVALFMLGAGIFVFKRLKPQFADVL